MRGEVLVLGAAGRPLCTGPWHCPVFEEGEQESGVVVLSYPLVWDHHRYLCRLHSLSFSLRGPAKELFIGPVTAVGVRLNTSNVFCFLVFVLLPGDVG